MYISRTDSSDQRCESDAEDLFKSLGTSISQRSHNGVSVHLRIHPCAAGHEASRCSLVPCPPHPFRSDGRRQQDHPFFLHFLARVINVTVAVYAGGKDVVEPLARVEQEVCGNTRGATLTVVQDSGHLMPLECPGEGERHILTLARSVT